MVVELTTMQQPKVLQTFSNRSARLTVDLEVGVREIPPLAISGEEADEDAARRYEVGRRLVLGTGTRPRLGLSAHHAWPGVVPVLTLGVAAGAGVHRVMTRRVHIESRSITLNQTTSAPLMRAEDTVLMSR